MKKKIVNALTIAGSDSSGGAGIQADLKTFSSLGAYGASVISALTAQNTQGVQEVFSIPASFLAAQCNSVFSDLHIDSVKCGMLANAEIIEVVATTLKRIQPPFFVLDTVMLSKGGDALLAPEAIQVLRDVLVPIANIITPNLPEAAALLNTSVAADEKTMCEQGRALLGLGAKAVLMKGGHLNDKESPDWLLMNGQEIRFPSQRIATPHTHGTGCALSAALTALRPQRQDWESTVRDAKAWLTQALVHAKRLSVGKGIGPPHHFHPWW